jgi:exonuclease VII small subunit
MKAPVYIKIEQYEDVLDLLHMTRKKLEVAKNTLQRLHDLKGEEDTKLEQWEAHLKEAEEKMDVVDTKLGQPE